MIAYLRSLKRRLNGRRETHARGVSFDLRRGCARTDLVCLLPKTPVPASSPAWQIPCAPLWLKWH